MKIINFLGIIAFSIQLQAQKHEFTGGIGFAQYYGDLNTINGGATPTSLFTDGLNSKSIKMSYSLGYRYNTPYYLSVGIQLSHLLLRGNDADNKSSQPNDAAFFRLVRNLDFYTDVNELSLDIRYEPFRNPHNWNKPGCFLSPSFGLGVGVFKFNPKTNYQGNEIELQPLGTEGPNKYKLTQFSLPLSVGLKLNSPNRKYAIGLDFTYHFTTTDYLDDVSTIYVDPSLFAGSNEVKTIATNLADRNLYGQNHPSYGYITSAGSQRGNSKNNDHFLTGQLKFCYYLGRTTRREVSCPSL
jgi:hypothetical protein